MREGFIVRTLQKWLNQYLEQLAPEQVAWSLRRGFLNLHRATLLPQTLYPANTGVTTGRLELSGGQIGQITLSLPWLHSWRKSFALVLDEVFLELRYERTSVETASSSETGTTHCTASNAGYAPNSEQTGESTPRHPDAETASSALRAAQQRATGRSSQRAAASIAWYLLERLGVYACSFRIDVTHCTVSIHLPGLLDTSGEQRAKTDPTLDAGAFWITWERLMLFSPANESEAIRFLDAMKLEDKAPSPEQFLHWLRLDGTICKCLHLDALALRWKDQIVVKPLYLRVMLLMNAYAGNIIRIWFQISPLQIRIPGGLRPLAALLAAQPQRQGTATPSAEAEAGEAALHGNYCISPETTEAKANLSVPWVPFWRAFEHRALQVACAGQLEALQIDTKWLTEYVSLLNNWPPLSIGLHTETWNVELQFWRNKLTTACLTLASLTLELHPSTRPAVNDLQVATASNSKTSTPLASLRLTLRPTSTQLVALRLHWLSGMLSGTQEDAPEPSTLTTVGSWVLSAPETARTRAILAENTADAFACQQLSAAIAAIDLQLSDALLLHRHQGNTNDRNVSNSNAGNVVMEPQLSASVQRVSVSDTQPAAAAAATRGEHAAFPKRTRIVAVVEVDRLHVELIHETSGRLSLELHGIRVPWVDPVDALALDSASIANATATGQDAIAVACRVYREQERPQAAAPLQSHHREEQAAPCLAGLQVHTGTGHWSACCTTLPIEQLDASAPTEMTLFASEEPFLLTAWYWAGHSRSQLVAVDGARDPHARIPMVILSQVSVRLVPVAILRYVYQAQESLLRIVRTPWVSAASTEQPPVDTSLDGSSDVQCQRLHLVIDWAGFDGTAAAGACILKASRMRLQVRKRLALASPGACLVFEAETLALELAQRCLLVQLSDLTAQLPLIRREASSVLASGVQTDAVSSMGIVRVGCLALEWHPSGICAQIVHMLQLWITWCAPLCSTIPASSWLRLQTLVEDHIRRAEAAAQAANAPVITPADEKTWRLSLFAIDLVCDDVDALFLSSSSSSSSLDREQLQAVRQHLACFVQGGQVTNQTAQPLLRFGDVLLDHRTANASSIEDAGRSYDLRPAALTCHWQQTTHAGAPTASKCALQIVKVRIHADEAKCRQLWSMWLQLEWLLHLDVYDVLMQRSTHDLVETIGSADGHTAPCSGQTATARQQCPVDQEARTATKQPASTALLEDKLPPHAPAKKDAYVVFVELHIQDVQLHMQAATLPATLVLEVGEIETPNLMDCVCRLRIQESQLWRLTGSNDKEQALTNQVDWVLCWQRDKAATFIRVPTVHALGTVHDLALLNDVLDWIRRLEDAVYQYQLEQYETCQVPSSKPPVMTSTSASTNATKYRSTKDTLTQHSASASEPAMTMTFTEDGGGASVARNAQAANSTVAGVPQGSTQLHLERFFFTLWPQHHTSKTDASASRTPGEQAPSSSSLRNPGQYLDQQDHPASIDELALADLAASKLTLQYRYCGRSEALRFQAQAVRLRTERSHYLGAQGELVMLPCLRVRYWNDTSAATEASTQARVQIRLQDARVFLELALLKRIWQEFRAADGTDDSTASAAEIRAPIPTVQDPNDTSDSKSSIDETNEVHQQQHQQSVSSDAVAAPESSREGDVAITHEAGAISWQLHLEAGAAPSLLLIPLNLDDHTQDNSSDNSSSTSTSSGSEASIDVERRTADRTLVVGLCFSGKAVFWDRPKWYRVPGYEQAYPRDLVVSSLVATASSLASYIDEQGRWRSRPQIPPMNHRHYHCQTRYRDASTGQHDSISALSSQAEKNGTDDDDDNDDRFSAFDVRAADSRPLSTPAGGLAASALWLRGCALHLQQCLVRNCAYPHVEKRLSWSTLDIHWNNDWWRRRASSSVGQHRNSFSSGSSSSSLSSLSTSDEAPCALSEPRWYQVDGRLVTLTMHVAGAAVSIPVDAGAGAGASAGAYATSSLQWSLQIDNLSVRVLQHVIPWTALWLQVQGSCRAFLTDELVLEPARLQLQLQQLERQTAAVNNDNDNSNSNGIAADACCGSHEASTLPARQTLLRLSSTDALCLNITPRIAAAVERTLQIQAGRPERAALVVPVRPQCGTLALVNASGLPLHLSAYGTLAVDEMRYVPRASFYQDIAVHALDQNPQVLRLSEWRRFLTSSSSSSLDAPLDNRSGGVSRSEALSWVPPDAALELVAIQALQWPCLVLVVVLYRRKSVVSEKVTATGQTAATPDPQWLCRFESPLYWENQTPLCLSLWTHDTASNVRNTPCCIARFEATANPTAVQNGASSFASRTNIRAASLFAPIPCVWQLCTELDDDAMVPDVDASSTRLPAPSMLRCEAQQPRQVQCSEHDACPQVTAPNVCRTGEHGVSTASAVANMHPASYLWSWFVDLAQNVRDDESRVLWLGPLAPSPIPSRRPRTRSARHLNPEPDPIWGVLLTAQVIRRVPTSNEAVSVPLVLVTLHAPWQIRNASIEPVFVDRATLLWPGQVYRSCRMDALFDLECALSAAKAVASTTGAPSAPTDPSRKRLATRATLGGAPESETNPHDQHQHQHQHPARNASDSAEDTSIPTSCCWQPAHWVSLALPEAFEPPPMALLEELQVDSTAAAANANAKDCTRAGVPGARRATVQEVAGWRQQRRPKAATSHQRHLPRYRGHQSKSTSTAASDSSAFLLPGRVWIQLPTTASTDLFPIHPWLDELVTSQTEAVVASDRGALALSSQVCRSLAIRDRSPHRTANEPNAAAAAEAATIHADAIEHECDDYRRRVVYDAPRWLAPWPWKPAETMSPLGTCFAVDFGWEHPRALRQITLCVPELWCSLWTASPTTLMQAIPAERRSWCSQLRRHLANWIHTGRPGVQSDLETVQAEQATATAAPQTPIQSVAYPCSSSSSSSSSMPLTCRECAPPRPISAHTTGAFDAFENARYGRLPYQARGGGHNGGPVCGQVLPLTLAPCPWTAWSLPELALSWRTAHTEWSAWCAGTRLAHEALVISLYAVAGERKPHRWTRAMLASPAAVLQQPSAWQRLASAHGAARAPTQAAVTVADAVVHVAATGTPEVKTSPLRLVRSRHASVSTPLETDARWPWLVSSSLAAAPAAAAATTPHSRLSQVSRSIAPRFSAWSPAAAVAETWPSSSSSTPTTFDGAYVPHPRQLDAVVCVQPLGYPLERSRLLVVYPRYRLVNLWPAYTLLVWPVDQDTGDECLSFGAANPRAGTHSPGSDLDLVDVRPTATNDIDRLLADGSVFRLEPGAMATLHWPAGTNKPCLRIRIAAPGWYWSGRVPVTAGSDWCLRLRQASTGACQFPRVHTAAGTSPVTPVHLVTILPPHPLLVPYRIRNQTIERIRFAQRLEPAHCRSGCCMKQTQDVIDNDALQALDPLSECAYTWDEPLAEPILELWIDGIGYVGAFRLEPELHSHASVAAAHGETQVATDSGVSGDRTNGRSRHRGYHEGKRTGQAVQLRVIPRLQQCRTRLWQLVGLGCRRRRRRRRRVHVASQTAVHLACNQSVRWCVANSAGAPGAASRSRTFQIRLQRCQATLALIIAENEQQQEQPAVPRRSSQSRGASTSLQRSVDERHDVSTETSPSETPLDALPASTTMHYAGAGIDRHASAFTCELCVPEMGISLLRMTTTTREPPLFEQVVYLGIRGVDARWHHVKRTQDGSDMLRQKASLDESYHGEVAFVCEALQLDHSSALQHPTLPGAWCVPLRLHSVAANDAASRTSRALSLASDHERHSKKKKKKKSSSIRPDHNTSRQLDRLAVVSWFSLRRRPVSYACQGSASAPGASSLSASVASRRWTSDDGAWRAPKQAACVLRTRFESSSTGAHTFLRIHSGQVRCGRLDLDIDASLVVQMVDWFVAWRRQVDAMTPVETSADALRMASVGAEQQDQELEIFWTPSMGLVAATSAQRLTQARARSSSSRRAGAAARILRDGNAPASRYCWTCRSGDTSSSRSSLSSMPLSRSLRESLTQCTARRKSDCCCCQYDAGANEALGCSAAQYRAGADACQLLRRALEQALLRGVPSVSQVQQRSERSLRLAFHDVVCAPLACTLSVRTDLVSLGTLLQYRGSEWPRLTALMLTPLMNVQDASLWLRELVLDGTFETSDDLVQHLVRHYQQQLNREVWKVISSAEWLGNPARYARHLSRLVRQIARQLGALLRQRHRHRILGAAAALSLGYGAGLGAASLDAFHRMIALAAGTLRQHIGLATLALDIAARMPGAAHNRSIPDANSGAARFRERRVQVSGTGGASHGHQHQQRYSKTDAVVPGSPAERASSSKVERVRRRWRWWWHAAAGQRMGILLATPLLFMMQATATVLAIARDLLDQAAWHLIESAAGETAWTWSVAEWSAPLRPPRMPSTKLDHSYDIEDAVLGYELWQMLDQASSSELLSEQYRFCCRPVPNEAVLCTNRRLWHLRLPTNGPFSVNRSSCSWQVLDELQWSDVIMLWLMPPGYDKLHVLALAPEQVMPQIRCPCVLNLKQRQHPVRADTAAQATLTKESRCWRCFWRRVYWFIQRWVPASADDLVLRLKMLPRRTSRGWRLLTIPLTSAVVANAVADRLQTVWYVALCRSRSPCSRVVVMERWWLPQPRLDHSGPREQAECPEAPWRVQKRSKASPDSRCNTTASIIGRTDAKQAGYGESATPDAWQRCRQPHLFHGFVPVPRGWADALYAYDASVSFPLGVYFRS